MTTFQSFLQLKTCSLYSVVQFAFAVSRMRPIKVNLSLFLVQHESAGAVVLGVFSPYKEKESPCICKRERGRI